MPLMVSFCNAWISVNQASIKAACSQGFLWFQLSPSLYVQYTGGPCLFMSSSLPSQRAVLRSSCLVYTSSPSNPNLPCHLTPTHTTDNIRPCSIAISHPDTYTVLLLPRRRVQRRPPPSSPRLRFSTKRISSISQPRKQLLFS